MHFHRKFAGVIAGIVTLTCLAHPVATVYAEAAGSYNMNVSVDLSKEKKEISPYIYGINQYGNTNNYKNVAVNAVRQGGNRYTGYNWETN